MTIAVAQFGFKSKAKDLAEVRHGNPLGGHLLSWNANPAGSGGDRSISSFKGAVKSGVPAFHIVRKTVTMRWNQWSRCRNRRSRWRGITGHDAAEWAVTMGWNTQ